MLRYGAASGAALAAGSLPGLANSASGPFKIALSNAYNGNEWRRQHAAAFEQAAQEMIGMGIFSEFSAVHGSDNSVPAQLAAIGDMILQGNDGIMINCSSGSQVGGVIEQAADAGIKVVSYDAYASSDRSHNIGFDFGSWGRNNAEFVENASRRRRQSAGQRADRQPFARRDRRQAHPQRVSANARSQSRASSSSARSKARRRARWHSGTSRRSFRASEDRCGSRCRRQRLLRHRRGHARLRLHHGEHAADLHWRRWRLYPVVERSARQARIQGNRPER